MEGAHDLGHLLHSTAARKLVGIVGYFDKLNIRKKDGYPEFTADDFIYDLQNNLCLLYHESGKYHFTHRSFQEYFCALYFSHQKDKALERIGESFEHRKYSSLSDKTFSMLYDMIPEKVEEYIFLPFLQKMFAKCTDENGYTPFPWKTVHSVTVSRRFLCDFVTKCSQAAGHPPKTKKAQNYWDFQRFSCPAAWPVLQADRPGRG